jgi:tRNA-Thr(GGU) m(6)t(6)A37 methyltransferase TsaA
MMEIRPIGVIRSPYRVPSDAPRQGRLSETTSSIEIFEEFAPGLTNIEQNSHLFILYWLDRADRTALFATPPGEERARGVFATRSPHRPNPIAIGIVDLLGIEGRRLTVRGLDALDGTPLLDLKPYSPSIDSIPADPGAGKSE